jgi:serine/threonine-protein kinase
VSWVVPSFTEIHDLGAGAAGRVVLARHEPTGAPVAIKYLSPELADDPDFRAGFRTEARVLGQLRSPYVARLYEYVEQQPHAAIVMELIDGVPLRTLLRRLGPTEPEAALAVLKGSMLGLAAAHEVGVVHRDYKPENVIVTDQGSTKLVDFGVAVRSGVDAPVAGTPSYMAPEQWTDGVATPSTDVYAATATFFECLTGAPPYEATDLDALRRQHAHAAIPLDAVPDSVRGIVRAGLAKDASRRPRDAAAFATELEAVASAAYGEDWEERGRAHLARRAALLLFLFPLAQLEADGTAVATSWLTRGRVVAAAVLATVLAGGGYAAAQLHGRPAGTTARNGGASFSYSLTVPPPAGPIASRPSASAPPQPRHRAAPRRTTSSPAVPQASSRAPAPSPSASPSSSSRSPAPAPAPGTSSTAPAVRKVHVVVTEFVAGGTNQSKLVLRVDTSTTAPVTITVRYFGGKTKAAPGGQDGAAVVIPLSGSTTYGAVADLHTWSVDATGCPLPVWFVAVTSTPTASNGTQQTYTGAPLCP